MKLISRQHDYYDTVQAHGYDTHITYCRKTKSYSYFEHKRMWTIDNVPVNPPAGVPEILKALQALIPLTSITLQSRVRAGLDFILFMVGGRLYPCVRQYEDGHVVQFHFEPTGVMAVCEEDLSKLPGWRRKFYKVSKEQVAAFFELRGSDRVMPLALQYGLICVRVSSSKVTIDPVLADYELFKTLPPFEAAQNIEMLLGNLAQPEKPMIALDDKYRVAAHGFTKESFRNTGGRLKAGRS